MKTDIQPLKQSGKEDYIDASLLFNIRHLK